MTSVEEAIASSPMSIRELARRTGRSEGEVRDILIALCAQRDSRVYATVGADGQMVYSLIQRKGAVQ
jgi:hypothetical protein